MADERRSGEDRRKLDRGVGARNRLEFREKLGIRSHTGSDRRLAQPDRSEGEAVIREATEFSRRYLRDGITSGTITDHVIEAHRLIGALVGTFRAHPPDSEAVTCPGCAAGETPVALDDDGVLTSVSGKEGRPGHAHDDWWYYCADFAPDSEASGKSDMVEEHDVRRHLLAFLKDDLSLDEFEDWLVGATWNMKADSGEDVRILVAEIELYLSEYSSDYLSYDALRSHLSTVADFVSLFHAVLAARTGGG